MDCCCDDLLGHSWQSWDLLTSENKGNMHCEAAIYSTMCANLDTEVDETALSSFLGNFETGGNDSNGAVLVSSASLHQGIYMLIQN